MASVYVSPSKTFSFEYPDDWKLERIDSGIITLRKKGGLFKKESFYFLRIKPLVSEKTISPDAYAAYVKLRNKEHPNLEIIEKSDSYIMNFNIIRYRQDGFHDTVERTFAVVQDFWELVISNRIFTCSFTVIKGEEESPKAQEERAAAVQILQSIQLL
jgi:hypothetical protein